MHFTLLAILPPKVDHANEAEREAMRLKVERQHLMYVAIEIECEMGNRWDESIVDILAEYGVYDPAPQRPEYYQAGN